MTDLFQPVCVWDLKATLGEGPVWSARDKAIGVPGTWGASTLGLANAKLDQSAGRPSGRPSNDDKA